jgi:hypothetical protein
MKRMFPRFHSLMRDALISQLDMGNTDEDILKFSLTALFAIDKRHKESFRCYMACSPFEYPQPFGVKLAVHIFIVNNGKPAGHRRDA